MSEEEFNQRVQTLQNELLRLTALVGRNRPVCDLCREEIPRGEIGIDDDLLTACKSCVAYAHERVGVSITQRVREPHTCPACGGAREVNGETYGFVPLGYPVVPVRCRTCSGTGVVWESQKVGEK